MVSNIVLILMSPTRLLKGQVLLFRFNLPFKERGKFNHITSPARTTSPPFLGSAEVSDPLRVDLSSHDSADNPLSRELARVLATETCGVGDGGVNTADV